MENIITRQSTASLKEKASFSTTTSTYLLLNKKKSGTYQPYVDYARKLTNLSKMYQPDLKYHGDDDSLGFKFNIFMELCEKSGVSEMLYDKAYSIMLKDPALAHCYCISANGQRNILC